MTLTPGQLTEPVKVSDSVQFLYIDQGTMNKSVSESLKVSDTAPTGSLRPLQASPTESLKVHEGTFLAFIGVGAILAEHVHVADAVLATLDPLQASKTERVRIRDTVTTGALILTFTVTDEQLLQAVDVSGEVLIPIFDIDEETIR